MYIFFFFFSFRFDTLFHFFIPFFIPKGEKEFSLYFFIFFYDLLSSYFFFFLSFDAFPPTMFRHTHSCHETCATSYQWRNADCVIQCVIRPWEDRIYFSIKINILFVENSYINIYKRAFDILLITHGWFFPQVKSINPVKMYRPHAISLNLNQLLGTCTCTFLRDVY